MSNHLITNLVQFRVILLRVDPWTFTIADSEQARNERTLEIQDQSDHYRKRKVSPHDLIRNWSEFGVDDCRDVVREFGLIGAGLVGEEDYRELIVDVTRDLRFESLP